jgi:hypothetical protein
LRNLRLICDPPDDAAFEAAVHELYAALAPDAESHESLATAIVTQLRDAYPSVRIRSRDPIAEFSVEQATWHVYRDGRPTRSDRSSA